MVSGMIGIGVQSGRGGRQTPPLPSGAEGPNSFSCQMVTRQSAGRIVPVRDEGRHCCLYVSRRKRRGGRTQPCGVPLQKWWWKIRFQASIFPSKRTSSVSVSWELTGGPEVHYSTSKQNTDVAQVRVEEGTWAEKLSFIMSCGSGPWLSCWMSPSEVP